MNPPVQAIRRSSRGRATTTGNKGSPSEDAAVLENGDISMYQDKKVNSERPPKKCTAGKNLLETFSKPRSLRPNSVEGSNESLDREAGQNDDSSRKEHFTRSSTEKTDLEERKKKEPAQELIEKVGNVIDFPAKPKLSLNGCANVLAALDSRSYHKALLHDANKVAERCLLPLSLPWTHNVVPVTRNIPCDIDEMIDIILLEDGRFAPYQNGSFGFGQYDTGQHRSGKSALLLPNSSGMFRAAARRSKDPGVIELRTVVLPPPFPDKCNESLEGPIIERSFEEFGALDYEEVLLRCFETTQARKRRRVLQTRRSVQSRRISVKLNSCSSRSSICNSKVSEGRELKAMLPPEVGVGKKLSNAKAKDLAAILGSYNMSDELDGIKNPSGKRTLVGRARLMWTDKRVEGRACYTSLITGQKLEPDAHKRPREVRLHIKLEGKFFENKDCKEYEQTVPSDRVTPFQATLHSDRFLQNLFAGSESKFESFENSESQIECVPDSCGSIHVMCVSPGKVTCKSVSTILNLCAAAGPYSTCCTVCWKSTEGGMPVMKCTQCDLLVHPECCLDSGSIQTAADGFDDAEAQIWTCAVCCEGSAPEAELPSRSSQAVKKSKRKAKLPSRFEDSEVLESVSSGRSPRVSRSREQQCGICLLHGGPMSRVDIDGRQQWIHEVCRIWTSNETRSLSQTNPPFCAICGGNKRASSFAQEKGSEHLARCAAAGCRVAVHPMCALVTSLYAKTKDNPSQGFNVPATDGVEDGRSIDRLLCSQYTMSFVSVKGETHACGKDPGATRKTTIPVIFCGFHNPKRDRSFYGLYPGGKFVHTPFQAITIPRCREPETNVRTRQPLIHPKSN